MIDTDTSASLLSRTSDPLVLAYSDRPAGSRLVVDDSRDRLTITILPSGTWRAFLWYLPFLCIGLLHAGLPIAMRYHVELRFGTSPGLYSYAWAPMVICLPAAAVSLLLARFEGAVYSVITMDSQRLSVRKAGMLRERTRSIDVAEIADVRLRFFIHVAIVTHGGKSHEWITGGRLIDRRHVVHLLRQRIYSGRETDSPRGTDLRSSG